MEDSTIMIQTTHLAIVIRLDQRERTRLRSRLIADVTRVQPGFHVVAMRMRSHELESDVRFCAKSPPPLAAG